MRDGGRLGGDTRACASENKRGYMRIHKNTSSSIRNGGGNCGKSKSRCVTRIFYRGDIFSDCGKSRDLVWAFLGKHLFVGGKTSFDSFLTVSSREGCRCGNFSEVFRWKTTYYLSTRVCGMFSDKIFCSQAFLWVFHIPLTCFWEGEPRQFRCEQGLFGNLHKVLCGDLCKTLLFPHSFPQPVEKAVENPQSLPFSWGFSVGKAVLVHRGGTTFRYYFFGVITGNS